MKILVLYYTRSGHTLEAVNATAEGIWSAGAEVNIVSVIDFGAGSIVKYDGLIVGSPCWAGSVIGSGIAKPLSKVLKALPADFLTMKRCGGISVHSTTGGANTVKSLGELLAKKGCEDFRPGPAVKAGVPLSLWKGSPVGDQDKAKLKAYGAEFVG